MLSSLWMRASPATAVAFVLMLAGCAEEPKAPLAGAGDANRGRQVYLAQCTSCHHSDPAKDGPVGPAVRGASRELLEARLLRGSYPAGYRPKRDTAVMQPVPHLAASIPDLAAYLQ